MTRREIKLAAKTVLWTLFVLSMVWFFWSWWDVVHWNNCGGTHAALNLCRLLLGA